AENCSLMLFDEKAGKLYLKAVKGENEKKGKYIENIKPDILCFSPGEGAAGHAVKSQKPVRIKNIFKDPVFDHTKKLRKNIKSLLCIPLIFHNKTIGVINLSSSKENFFKEEDERILTIIANQASVILQNVKLVHNLEKTNRILKITLTKLRESKEKYQKLFNNSIDIVYTLDTRGNFTSINDAVKKLTGFKKSEIIGKNFSYFKEYIDKKEVSRVKRKFKKILKTESSVFDLPITIKTKSKTTKFFETNVTLIKNEKGEIIGFQGSARDVTERKALEKQIQDYTANLEKLIMLKTEELRISEKKYRSIAENINDIVYIYNNEGRMTYVSPSLKKILGIEPEEWLLNYKYFFTDSPINNQWKEAFELHRKGIEVNPFLIELWDKNGNKVLMESNEKILKDENGNITGVQGVLRDVTEKSKLEKNIKESEEYHKTLIHSLNECVFTVKKDILTWCNSKVKEVFGYSPKEITGKHISILMKKDKFNEIKKKHFITLMEKGFVSFETLFRKKNGKEFDVDVSIALMKKENRKNPEETAILVARDITRKKELEKSLIFSERLAATGKLAASIAHEINNPLQGIQTHIDVLQEGYNNNLTDSESFKHIRKGINQINRIVKQLLNIHRPIEMEKSYVNLTEIMDSILELIKGKLYRNNVKIKKYYPVKPVYILASREQIGQVFLNIILNANDSMPEGGNLDIKITKTKNIVKVIFTDTGIGIKKSYIRKIFDPFFSTKTDKMGVGLGLSVSYGIIKNHKGDITVKSKPGKGTTFTISLPVYKTL
ncbi:hypothetical protein DRQ09_08550, partial [candidate division KSB1 bacterium]